MKTEAEFESFFSATLQTELEGLEILRRRKFIYFYLYLLIAVLAGAVIFIHYSGASNSAAYGLVFLWIILNLSFHKAILEIILSDYVDAFKEKIVAPMIHFYNPGLKYDPESGILKAAVLISNIFRGPFTVYTSDDYVEGKIGETIIQFSEVFIGKKNLWIKPTFSGLFMIASFNKNFKGEYLIRSDNSEEHFGESLANLLKRLGSASSCLMKMDNPEFQKAFTVYGTDEQEARYLLSPSVMTAMLDFQKKVGNKVSYSFARSKIFLAISTEENLFEPSLMKPMDVETIYRWNRYLVYAFSVVDEFNLNTRIWSKR